MNARAYWLVSSEYPVLFTSEQLEKKWRPGLHPWQVKKSSKLFFSGVYYLTVLVSTKTTIHLSVGGYIQNIHR